MKHYYIFFINLFFFSQASFGQLSKFEESYIKTFDPQGYSYYKFGEGIANQGKQIAEKSANFTLNIEQPLSSLPEDQKKDILAGLLKVIYQLNKAGVITIQRMCFTCSYYQNEDNEHFCKLLQSKLASKELRIDCPEHEFKS